MNKFNNDVINGNAIKRAYGGATTSRLKYYAKAVTDLDQPDTIIINAGTNNFTKTQQTIEDIASEILDIVDISRKGGVQNIFVSSITCRPLYQAKIDGLNRLLKDYAAYYNYTYIDNSRIQESHVRKDGVHLNQEGISILANNFLYYLNRPYKSFAFTSIWD